MPTLSQLLMPGKVPVPNITRGIPNGLSHFAYVKPVISEGSPVSAWAAATLDKLVRAPGPATGVSFTPPAPVAPSPTVGPAAPVAVPFRPMPALYTGIKNPFLQAFKSPTATGPAAITTPGGIPIPSSTNLMDLRGITDKLIAEFRGDGGGIEKVSVPLPVAEAAGKTVGDVAAKVPATVGQTWDGKKLAIAAVVAVAAGYGIYRLGRRRKR